MPAGFVTVPARDVALRRGRIPQALLEGPAPGPADGEGLVGADIVIRDGRIAGIAPTGSVSGTAAVDLDDGQVWPCFVDLHTHLDKGHIWPRAANPDGTFQG